MKQRLCGALSAGLMLFALLFSLPVRAAEQSNYVAPTSGPMSMATFVGYLNPALRAIASCHNGSSTPANGPGSAPLAYQCWVDTTANPALYKIYDGASWLTLGSINTSTHLWTPYRQGSPIVAVATSGSASDLTAGTLASTRGGAGGVNGALKGNGSGTVSQAACADLSNAAASCSTNTTTQANVAFTGLTSAGAAADADTFPTNQGASNLKQTLSAIKTWIKAWIVKGDVGLGNVDNTSDVNKPVSTAQAAADALKANLASPALTGVPTAPTASANNNSTQIATTAYADTLGALKANASRTISAGCGLAGGGDLSADRTLRISLTVNAQTGTSYTVLDGDCGKLVSFNNASPVAVTLPQANGSTFVSGWNVSFQNKGAGTATITPTTSTINGGASIALTQNQGMYCSSDGANYTCVLGVGAGGGAGTVTQVVCGTGLDGGTITASGTCSLSSARRTLPTRQLLTASSGTYTTPANVLWIELRMVGAGAGGSGAGTASQTAGGNGGNTCWNTSGAACTTPVYQAGGGVAATVAATTAGANASPGGAGGAIAGSTTPNLEYSAGSPGGASSPSQAATNNGTAGPGGNSCWGAGGNGGTSSPTAGGAGANYGGGGGGGGVGGGYNGGSGGGSGACIKAMITSPAASYTYANGAAGSAGGAGTGGAAGGAGAAGAILVIEHYGS